MDESFKAFLQQPANRALVEACQRKEVLKAVKQKERAAALEFRSQVLDADPHVQQDIVPYLKHRALRLIVKSLTNDPDAGFTDWASNPQVLHALAEAKRLLDEGRMTEEEMEATLLAQLQGLPPDDKAAVGVEAAQRMCLPPDQLAAALNEHLMERRAGNAAYKRRDFETAKRCYALAQSIVKVLKAQSPTEQHEIDANLAIVMLNTAAVHMELGEHRQAAASCSKALKIEPGNAKGLLRRAKALGHMHDTQAALDDLAELKRLGVCKQEAEAVRAFVLHCRRAATASDQSLFRSMLK